jgi:hypothetical protein
MCRIFSNDAETVIKAQLINWFRAIEIKIQSIAFVLPTITPKKRRNMSRIFLVGIFFFTALGNRTLRKVSGQQWFVILISSRSILFLRPLRDIPNILAACVMLSPVSFRALMMDCLSNSFSLS